MSGSAFINDSFTFAGRVDATPGLHPAVKFTYRSGGMPARIALESATGTAKQLDTEAKILRDHLKTFVVIHDDGSEEAFALTESQTVSLQPAIFRGILNRILGYIGPSLESEGNGSAGVSA